jgi:alkylhydroperoxidase/carboxymuconolactone decarboxylase family protein YurZ
MTTNGSGCGGNGKEGKQAVLASASMDSRAERSSEKGKEIVDYKVTMLIAAGAAMAANCEMCLNKIVPDLLEAGVAETDIRRAVEIGQFVKDKPATMMKEAADTLTGTSLSSNSTSGQEGCPAEKRKEAGARA